MFLLTSLANSTAAGAHSMQSSDPLNQPESPIHLKSCYMGTNFMFGDAKYASEQDKMQLGVTPDGKIPSDYRGLALRFQFTNDAGQHSSDVVIFTGTMTSPAGDIMGPPSGMLLSAYLPRVEPYENYRCGVEFAAGASGTKLWMPADGYVLSFAISGDTKTSVGDVGLNALELTSQSSTAVFIRDGSSEWLLWSLDGGPRQTQHFDQFDRAVVELGKLDAGRHCVRYGLTKRG